MVTCIFIIFIGIALILWMTIFGYLFILSAFTLRHKPVDAEAISLPEIAVVIPTLNEESLILAKLDNLRESDYPQSLIKVFVIDGGSSDKTVAKVIAKLSSSLDLELIQLNNTRSKAEQTDYALKHINHDIIVFTDVDARLEPSCLRELVTCLINDPSAAIVGAFIKPDTPLLEERLYWWFINHLWWLEGEVLSLANVSGVCYVCRRKHILPVAGDALADDINVALSAGATGHRVRICRKASAEEIRVPLKPKDLVRFRRSRGAGYLRELKRFSKFTRTSFRWRLVRLLRLWHFLVTPKAIIISIFLGVTLIFTRYWLQVFYILVGFSTPIFLALHMSNIKGNLGCRWRRLPFVALRMGLLTVISILTLKITQKTQVCKRGQS